jgi:glycosyltransferase involved in cell wall biosynthesis
MKISIITPCFNSEKYIAEAIDSIKTKYPDLVEHIVADGGSTDNTVEVLKSYNYKHNLSWISEPDEGLYDALNKALSRAKGEYIGWLNSDDIYAEGILDKVIELAENSETKIYSGDGDLFYHNDKGEMIVPKLYEHYRGDVFDSKEQNLRYTHLNCCFIPKAYMDKIGTFDKSFKIAADRLYMSKLIQKKYPCFHLGQVVCSYRMHEDSLTFNQLNGSSDGASLALDHPVRKEIIKVVSYIFNSKFDFGLRKWASIKWMKYMIIFAILKFKKGKF